MIKDQFQVWRYNFPDRGEHPCVIISHPDIAEAGRWLNVLYCTSQRQNRPVQAHEVMLDSADGLDWETFCLCDRIWLVESKDLFGRRGMVGQARRNQIRRKVRELFRLDATD
ncbi:MAG TPA: type II toxin-antitoxin system PemK/MazF family toxin [Verrucomicrobiae bacterium]|nr:type II toxin-antitoxin system PemK/MazF family toxin [Verrucomicrobiae bacterium]